MDVVEYAEKYLGIKLLDCQKDVVQKMVTQNYPQLYILPARHNGKINCRLLEAILEWNELNESKN